MCLRDSPAQEASHVVAPTTRSECPNWRRIASTERQFGSRRDQPLGKTRPMSRRLARPSPQHLRSLALDAASESLTYEPVGICESPWAWATHWRYLAPNLFSACAETQLGSQALLAASIRATSPARTKSPYGLQERPVSIHSSKVGTSSSFASVKPSRTRHSCIATNPS